jgi:hypothetical protein
MRKSKSSEVREPFGITVRWLIPTYQPPITCDCASRSRRRRATNPSPCGTEGEGEGAHDEERSIRVPCSRTNLWEGIFSRVEVAGGHADRLE